MFAFDYLFILIHLFIDWVLLAVVVVVVVVVAVVVVAVVVVVVSKGLPARHDIVPTSTKRQQFSHNSQ